MRSLPLAAALALVALVLVPRTAEACDVRSLTAPATPLAVLPDGARPPRPIVVGVTLKRGVSTRALGCATSCDDVGILAWQIQLPDPSISPLALGYRLEVVGRLPKGLVEPPEGTLAPFDCGGSAPGRACMLLSWIDEARNDQDPFSMELTVAAVDGKGRIGPWSQAVAVEHDGVVRIPADVCRRSPDAGAPPDAASSDAGPAAAGPGPGCSLAPDRGGAGDLLLLSAVVALARRARRRRGRGCMMGR